MQLSVAKALAEKFIKEIEQYCSRVEIVGSIRREKALDINDVDLLIIPKNSELFNLFGILTNFGVSKITTITRLEYDGQKFELHFSTQERWIVDLVVTTGSEDSNKKLAEACKRKGCHLSVSKGQIIDSLGRPISVESEEDVFNAADLPYLEPSKRSPSYANL